MSHCLVSVCFRFSMCQSSFDFNRKIMLLLCAFHAIDAKTCTLLFSSRLVLPIFTFLICNVLSSSLVKLYLAHMLYCLVLYKAPTHLPQMKILAESELAFPVMTGS